MKTFTNAQRLVFEPDLEEVENSLGFKFPTEVKEHYLRVNGGRPVVNLFQKDGQPFRVDEFLAIKHGDPETTLEGTYRRVVGRNPFFPDYLVPIAVDQGGDFFCFSRRNQDYGAMYCYRNDYF